ncbi:MAG: SDR family oxidoreductase [Novosphingobium sp.]|nr:SDR family oxidoreductase [Novosphingobium sp.]
MTGIVRRKALITGAAGGMGRACAWLFGATCDLVLSDVSKDRLDAFAKELRDAGNIVTAHAGDMLDEAHLASLAAELDSERACSVIHTAGLSPALADWQAIMKVNLVASEMLMQALKPRLAPGSVVVPIASMAGHMMPAIPEIDALLVDPLADGFIQGIGAAVEAMGGQGGDVGKRGVSYSLSKRGVHLHTERWGIALGSRGVRVVSISPGVIHTPMGLAENEKTPGAADTMNAAVVGRIGTPMDIAMAAKFLCSDEASFITATDLKVDGGSTASLMPPKG